MDTLFPPQNNIQTRRILHTPSSFARENLFYLQEVGTLTSQNPHIKKRKYLTSYLFFIVLDGSGTLTYEKEEFQLKKGDCVFIDCKRSYSQKTEQDLWSLQWIHFNSIHMDAIYQKYLAHNGSPCFLTKKSDLYGSILTDIYQIADSPDPITDIRISEKLSTILTLLMEETVNPLLTPLSSKKYLLKEIKTYLENHYTEKILLDDLSKKFFINKFYLTRIFKEYYGVSIYNYILQLRITQSKKLLRFSELSIEMVAYHCGITDANNFSRIFKKIEGVSPREFRNMW